MSGQEGFAYSPLQGPTSFRLLELLPGNSGERLSCRIRDSDLSSCPNYEAISYVWGTELDKVCLLCNGQDFHVTRNLADALVHFHDEAKSRILWVDSICIDQNNIAEKNHQVAVMSQIYGKASQVLIWLGKEEFMDAAMVGILLLHERVAPRIAKLVQYEEQTITPSHQKPHSEELVMNFGIPPAEAEPFEALNSLLRSAWFTRAWTFQESYLAKAKSFHFADYQVSDTIMLNTFIMLYHLMWAGFGAGKLNFQHHKLLPMLVGTVTFPKVDSEALKDSDFQALLRSRRGSGCKLPSDCLYSLLAVMPTSLCSVPDYSKPFHQVFAEFAFACITSTDTLAIFHHIINNPSNADCPTWVPDWRIAAIADKEEFTKLGVRRYSCTGPLRPVVHVSSDWKEITIQGILYDQVVAVVDPFSVENHPLISQRINEVDETDRLTFQDGGVKVPRTMTRILCSDLALYDEANPDSRWGSSYDSFAFEMAAESELEDSPKKRRFAYKLGQSARDRCMILTSKHRLGMAFNTTEPGDVVTLLFGGEVPIILRPKDGKYIFIGECFIDGIMDGQGLIQALRVGSEHQHISDSSWLDHLSAEPSLFDTESFVIV